MELLGDLKEWAPCDTAAGRKIEELARFNAKSKAAVAESKETPREAAAAENAAALFGQDAGEIKRQLQAAPSKYQYGLTSLLKRRTLFQ